MTFSQIETFYWIVKLGGFSAAAVHLNATQPAISGRIRALETSLGVILFDRVHKGAHLTGKGRALFHEAEKIILDMAILRQTISDPALIGGTVRLGVAELVAVTWLSSLVSTLNENYPRLSIDLDVDLTANLLEKLSRGRLDLALLPGPIFDSSLMAQSIGRVAFKWMASPKLGMSSGKLSPSDLANRPIITLPPESNLHGVLENWFAEADAELNRIDVCNSLTVLSQMVAAGIGLGYLSISQTEALRAEGLLQVLDTVPEINDLEYFAVYPRRSMMPIAPLIATVAAQESTFDFCG